MGIVKQPIDAYRKRTVGKQTIVIMSEFSGTAQLGFPTVYIL